LLRLLEGSVGSRKVATTGVLISAAGLLALAASSSYTCIAASIVAFASGVALITASIPPLISELAGVRAHGAALGAMETIKDVGQALRPIATGLFLTYLTYPLAFAAIAAVMSLALPVTALFFRK